MILADAERLTTVRADGEPLFTDVSVTVASGDRLGVVGINGSGKSTLLRALAGRAPAERGTLRLGRDATVTVLDQQAPLPPGTVQEALGDGWEAAAVADRLGLTPVLDRDVATLSGGQAKRTALARALLALGGDAGEGADHDLLLLDEPTNHLDIDGIEWMEERLARFRGGLVLVTHDRHLLDRLTTKVLELDRGQAFVHVPQGATAGSGYAAYLEGRAVREERAAQAEQTRRNLARTELAWLRRGAPARTSKPKARIDAAKAIVDGRAQAAARSGSLDLGGLGATRLGSKVVDLQGVGHRWHEGAPWLFRGVDLAVEPGDRIGVVGPNGLGKSTLLDVIAGRLTPAEGAVDTGSTVRLGYLDQRGRDLPLTARVRDVVAGPTRAADWQTDALLDRFWFDDAARWAPVGRLSGGERRRLQLVLVLSEQPNVLLLDEPTNDLDLDTLRAIEDFLEGWAGALVVVSHDRAFLERTVEHVVSIEPGGRAGLVPGGFGGWMGRRRDQRPAVPAGSTGSGSGAVPGGSGRPLRARTGRSPSTLQRLLREAERDLGRATERRDALVGDLTGTTDHQRLADLGARLTEAEQAVQAAEERWLALAEEMESS